jgi:DNA-binding response OmpR family regulator
MSTNKKILIVDDETKILELLAKKFSDEGFDVIKARDGEEGLKLAISKKPDVILLDIIMPKMDGLTMLQRLRKDSWGRGVKVVILTNLSDGESLSQALEGRAFDFLIKSDWKLEDVIKKVKARLVS